MTADRIRVIDSYIEQCRKEWYERGKYDQDAELERLEGIAEYKARSGGDDDGCE